MSGAAELAASGPLLLALAVCVLAGLVSFASPCVIPLVPGYLSYLAAVVGVDDRVPAAVPSHTGMPVSVGQRTRWRVVGSALLFVAGFTAVFIAGTVAVLGMTTTLITNQLALQRVGGVLTIVMGLAFIGFIPALQRQARFTPRTLSTIAGAPALTAQQQQAIQATLAHKLTILTGGPGTGKTTTLRTLLDTLDAGGHSYALASPTGRAAK